MKLGQFYPTSGLQYSKDTFECAVEGARAMLESKKETPIYIVQIVGIVAREPAPVKVTRFER